MFGGSVRIQALTQASPRPTGLKEDNVRSSKLPREEVFCAALCRAVRAAGWAVVLIPALTTSTALRGQAVEALLLVKFLDLLFGRETLIFLKPLA